MAMLRFFLNFFAIPPSKKKLQRRKEQSINALVKKRTSGSVRIQSGHYITEAGVDKLREKVLSHNY